MISRYLVASLVAACSLVPSPAGAADSPYPRATNIATGKPVQFQTPPTYPDVTDAGDTLQLVDGALAAKTPLWYDSAAVGWVGTDPVVLTLDLGTHQPIRGLAVHTAAGQSGVEWPARIDVLVSVDGKRFTTVGDLVRMNSHAKPPTSGYAAAWLANAAMKSHGRYVRLVVSPRNLGGGAYVMIDELEVYRGEDAWLDLPLEAANAPTRWTAEWGGMRWTDGAGVPPGERPTRIRYIDDRERTDEAPLFAAEPGSMGVTFTVRGEAGVPRRMAWTHELRDPVATDKCRYAVLTFRAQRLRTMYEPFPAVELRGMNDGSDASTVTLLDANAAPSDGLSHTVVKELPPGFTLQELRCTVVTESSDASLTLERLELLDAPPAEVGVSIEPASESMPTGYQTVALTGALNDSMADWSRRQMQDHGVLMDGVTRLPTGPVSVSGVPFLIAEGEQNLAAMPVSQPEQGQVEFLGEMVEKRHFNPASRHDQLSLPVGAHAREVFLLLTLNAPPAQRRGGHTYAPLRLDDIESLSLELVYAEGEPTLAFPYSIADEACYIPSRGLGAYAVAADPDRRLERIVLHNRHFGPKFAVAGVTLNTSAEAFVPQLATVAPPAPTRRLAEPVDRPAAVRHEGNRLILSNRWYEVGIDLANGFVIDRLVSRWNEETPLALDPSSGLRVRLGDAIYTGRAFTGSVVRVADTEAVLKLTSKHRDLPLDLEVTLGVTDAPELSFATRAINRGDGVLTPAVSLPALAGLVLGEPAETRLFFPQYRAVDTARHVTLKAPYGPEFAQQFMGIYNREAGVGLMIRTDNKDQQEAKFSLAKSDEGVAAGVYFPSDYTPLAKGAAQRYPAVSLTFHTGDWREAMRIQRDWIRTWYAPVKSQDEAFFLEAWDLMCYRPSAKISWQDSKVPPIINAERTKFLTAASFEIEKQTLGHVPDFVHFFNWTHNDQTGLNEYGIHGTPKAYAQVGGLEFFRKGIREIQEDYDTPVSLYALIDRARASALPDPELARHVVESSWHQAPDSDSSAGLRASGLVDGIYYMPRGDERWLDFAIDDVVRMQRDTGCRLVYLDVFSHWSHLGSTNGVSPRAADMKVLTRLRDELPDEVVFWSEYPPTDFGTQYADGALHYYFLDLNETFARPYDDDRRPEGLYRPVPMNAGRFLLTDYKFIGIPVYMEVGNGPSQVDALFVNAEAFQEDTWRIHHSRIRERLNRGYEVKHAYTDAFNSAEPQPQVDTLVDGITANLFPGEGRNVWTLYNGRPATFIGNVLAVPHRAGATYRDAWNDEPIEPAIQGDVALIPLSLDPQELGCVVQE